MKSASSRQARRSAPSSRVLQLLRFGLCLLPLTAVMVTRQSHYSYTLGKAVFFRILIEILLIPFVALLTVNWRDARFLACRSPLALVVVAYVVAAQVATLFSLDRAQSWWGTLARMDGAFATLHFLVLFLLLAGVFRTAADWRLWFQIWLVSSIVVAVLALHGHFVQKAERPGSTLGAPGLPCHLRAVSGVLWRLRPDHGKVAVATVLGAHFVRR